MLDSYRTILRHPGAARFSATGLVARLPISMVGLGIVLLVQGTSGSYGLAGSVSAAHVLANAALAVPQGRLVDRLGQGRVLPLVVSVWGGFLVLLMVSVLASWPDAVSYGCAVVAGAALPAVGSCVRARWVLVLPDPAQRQTAFALEAVVDEGVFMVGPILVTLLSTLVHPAAGLAAAVAAGVAGTWALGLQRVTEPPAHPRDATSASVPMPWRTVVPLALVCLALGCLFGAAEVTTVAFAGEQGSKAVSGPLLALWALGSLAAGVVTGVVRWRHSVEVRLRVGAAALTATMVPLALVGSTAALAPLLLLSGLAIAPTLIATMTLAEHAVPPSRLTEGMAFLQTGIVAGVAPGAALAGVVVDHHGASSAYLVSVAGGAVALVAALLTRAPRPGTPPSDAG